MNEGPHITSEELAGYLSGEADAAGRLAVESWAAASSTNLEELERLRRLWGMTAGPAMADVDVDRAWSRLEARIGTEHQGRVITLQRPAVILRWLAAAAVLTGLFVGVRYWNDQQPDELMAMNEHVRTVLQDSSRVILSPGTRMNVRMKDDRHVDLQGEAYFEVQRDVERPFVVETADVTVTVLGTAFEVSAFDTASSVLVRVRHGKVRVVANGDGVVLEAGGYARYNKAAHLLERLASPPAEVWGDRVIQFQQASMTAVVEQLQRLFKVRIRLANDDLANCRLTATFEDEPIDYILRVIADTYGLALTEETPGTYVLDGDGC